MMVVGSTKMTLDRIEIQKNVQIVESACLK